MAQGAGEKTYGFKVGGSGELKPYYYRLGKGWDRIRSHRWLLGLIFLLSLLIPSFGWGSLGIFYAVISILSLTGILTFLPRGFDPKKIIEELLGLGEKLEGWSSYNTRVPLIAKTRDGIMITAYSSEGLMIIASDASGHLPVPMGSKSRITVKTDIGKKEKKRLRRTREPVIADVEMIIPSLRSPIIFTLYKGRAVIMMTREKHKTALSYAEDIERVLGKYRSTISSPGF